MRVIVGLLVVCGLMAILAAQRMSASATVTSSQRATEPLAFSNPSLHLSGTIRPRPGHRLHLIVISTGDVDINADVRRFALISVGGARYEPIAVGGGADLIFPLASLPLGREIGQILAADAIVATTRRSSTSVVLEAGPRATLAFVYELPQDASLRSLRLPDGSELALDQ